MKRLLSPLVFAFALVLGLTQTTAAFPGMNYSGTANVTNIDATIDVFSILGIAATHVDVIVGTTQSNASGSTTELMAVSGESIGAIIDGTVLGITILDNPIADTSSHQSYLSPSETNPDVDNFSILDVDEDILGIGTVNSSSISALLDNTRDANLVNATMSRADNISSLAGVNLGLPLLDILDVAAAYAETDVVTSDESMTTTKGYDAISCEATSRIEDLGLLGLVSADLITTATAANVNGQTGESSATITLVNLEIGETVIDSVTYQIGSTPPLRYNLLGGDVVVTIAPVLDGSATGQLATAQATALRVEILDSVLGLGAGTIIDIGSSDVACAAKRGNWSPTDDTDGDGVKDLVDLDDDNDGLPDVFEGDAELDTDGDGIPDSRDLDSDNDGANDVLEAGHADKDINGDGQIDGVTSLNGLSDLVEVGDNTNSAVLNYVPRDSDGDNVPDVRDLDSDNDSLLDVVENGFAAQDADGNGMLDAVDDDFDGIISVADLNVDYGDQDDGPQADADGDGIPNSRDLDSDNDGTLDLHENGQQGLDLNNDGMADGDDSDLDGIVAGIDQRLAFYGTISGVTVVDTDNDNVPDAYDLDSDNDGATDLVEAGYGDLDTLGAGTLSGDDNDFDGIIDVCDILPATYGSPRDTALPDADSDGTPDMQETDSDNDGVNDIEEFGSGVDDNNDGMSDGGDDDGDGIPESADTAPDTFGLNNDNSVPTAITLVGSSTQNVRNITFILLLIALATAATAYIIKRD